MSTVAVVTIVSGRHDHLRRQHEALARCQPSPDRVVVVAMADPAVPDVVADGPLRDVATLRAVETTPLGLPLAVPATPAYAQPSTPVPTSSSSSTSTACPHPSCSSATSRPRRVPRGATCSAGRWPTCRPPPGATVPPSGTCETHGPTPRDPTLRTAWSSATVTTASSGRCRSP